MVASNKLSAKEAHEKGYLQEVNRQFFHPLGLAMWVDIENDTMGIFDYRDDPEGSCFASPSLEKASLVSNEQRLRSEARLKALGYWIQPVEPMSKEIQHHPV